MRLATQKEILENIRDELSVRPKNGHEGTTQYFSEEYREGFDKGAEEMAKIAKEREAKLVESTEDIVVWLKRMSLLAWEDPDYAPNFKKSFMKLEQALADHKRMMEGE